jgi:hypothetical protein
MPEADTHDWGDGTIWKLGGRPKLLFHQKRMYLVGHGYFSILDKDLTPPRAGILLQEETKGCICKMQTTNPDCPKRHKTA